MLELHDYIKVFPNVLDKRFCEDIINNKEYKYISTQIMGPEKQYLPDIKVRNCTGTRLFEEDDKGDCFEVAGRAMIDLTEEQEMYGMKLVHAYVYGQGDLTGRRFEHAWNEQGDVVLDNSNGNSVVLRKEQYYEAGGVVGEAGAYASYDKEKSMINLLKHGHWGPWDLNDGLREGEQL